MEDFKAIKKNTKNGESTDDEEIEEELNKIYEQNKQNMNDTHGLVAGSEVNNETRMDQTLCYLNKKEMEAEASDEDYDFKEFEDAGVEEAEDRIYSEYKHAKNTGKVVDENVLMQLAGDVPLDDMETSIIMSARQGAFTRVAKPNRSDSSYLDMSALSAMPVSNHKKGAMERMMEQTAQSQNVKKGNFRPMLNHLKESGHEHGKAPGRKISEDNDLYTSQKSSEIAPEPVMNSGRQNPAIGKVAAMDIRRSKVGSVVGSEALGMVQEDSQDNEDSRISPSGNIDSQETVKKSKNSAGLNMMFEATAAQNEVESNTSINIGSSSPDRNNEPAPGGGGLGNIFAQTAKQQDRKKMGF